MALKPSLGIGAAGRRLFIALTDFIGSGFDQFSGSPLAAQAVIDESMDDVIVAGVTLDKIDFTDDLSLFIFDPNLMVTVL